MDLTITAPIAQGHAHAYSSTPTNAGVGSPQKYSICNCDIPPSQAYLHPIIGCTNSKCRPRYYHLRCVGLFHRADNEFTWLCPTCAPDAPIPPRICICEDPPYRTGPMVECTQQEFCKTRWFHAPCTGVWPGGDATGWTCAECVVGIIMQQDYEEELERRRANGEVVEDEEVEVTEVVQQEQEKEKEVEPPQVDGEAVEPQDEDDEVEQREYVSDGVPGVFLGEEDEAPQLEVVPAPPLKRKSSDEAETPPRKKAKRAAPSPPLSSSPEPEPEYCICGTPADDEMIACDAPDCHAEWFHFVCVGLTPATIPEGEWFCDECAEVREKAKKNKKKKKKDGKGKGKGRRKR